ncbi:hypothetical protein [Lysobacter capsici]|uniref:hypothetical protein n=1 Tax=Lysobacter capsici TaxID=435897 RepID=UPI000AF02AD3|nr:hypothetical protein [Lysobacter capsici]
MTDLTPEQSREHHIARIRDYAIRHGLTGERIALIFESGLAAASRLRPELAPPLDGEQQDGPSRREVA